MSANPSHVFLGLLLITMFSTSEAQAGTITGVAETSGPGRLGAPAIAADSVTLDKRLDSNPTDPKKPPVFDTVFNVANSGGVTEYLFTDTVLNNTGLDWLDYHFALGFGTGAGFRESGRLDMLDFDVGTVTEGGQTLESNKPNADTTRPRGGLRLGAGNSWPTRSGLRGYSPTTAASHSLSL